MTLLSNQTLSNLPQWVDTFAYDRRTLKAGIVHLGLGAFHRAHQAFYTDRIITKKGGDWGIVGASLRSESMRTLLKPQDFLYTLVERRDGSDRFRVLGALLNVLVAPENPSELVQVMADPGIKIITLTVTEKGYCQDSTKGALDLSHPDIQADLKAIDKPRSAIGFLVSAAKVRMVHGRGGFTALSCDNLPGNGRLLKASVLRLAREVSPELAGWISRNVGFPCSMVDRIVPACTPADKSWVFERLGLKDSAPLVTEPFSQWVVEDKFVAGRPDWDQVGVQLVEEVEIYELMKLRMLNGAHSLLAYLGYLAGYEYVDQAMTDPTFVKLLEVFHEREAAETLDPPQGFDLAAYAEQLRERFTNPALKHRTWQIAMDGSQKLPGRWLEGLRHQLRHRGAIDLYCLGVAAWIKYVSGVDESGQAIEVSDPMAGRLRQAYWQADPDAISKVRALVGIEAVFGPDLIHESRFLENTAICLAGIEAEGCLASLKRALTGL